ncbi:MAG TPA: XRE family transcriptional regulator [Bryobacteraceae bacterium]|nr:XRE family transcriptional regulator [Bryobacteraceae bacterium]
MSATPAFISPSVLRWARQRSGLSVDELAQRVNTRPDRLTAWEQGDRRPSIRQAEHVAGALHIPFGYLFLSEPPNETLPIADFRSGTQFKGSMPSADLIDVLNDAIIKQQWYREFLREENRARVPFVGQFRDSTDSIRIARSIRETIGISTAVRGEASNWEGFLSEIVKRSEAIGILVLKSGIVGGNPHRRLKPEEFRGFTINDEFAPLIFVNGADARAAQIFTLAHELAHIWIGQSGVSDEKMNRITDVLDSRVEVLCDHIAAEVLVPSEEFKSHWDQQLSVEMNIQVVSRHFKVSRLVALRRGFDLGKIDREAFLREYKTVEGQYRLQEEEREGGNFFPTLFVRNSATFTRTVIGAVNDGHALYREAAQLLNVKVPTVAKVIAYAEGKAQ